MTVNYLCVRLYLLYYNTTGMPCPKIDINTTTNVCSPSLKLRFVSNNKVTVFSNLRSNDTGIYSG